MCEKYAEYSLAIADLIKNAGAAMQSGYTPEESFIGDWKPDVFFVVRYTNKTAFEKMINSPEYEAVKHLRTEALQDSLLVRCKPLN